MNPRQMALSVAILSAVQAIKWLCVVCHAKGHSCKSLVTWRLQVGFVLYDAREVVTPFPTLAYLQSYAISHVITQVRMKHQCKGLAALVLCVFAFRSCVVHLIKCVWQIQSVLNCLHIYIWASLGSFKTQCYITVSTQQHNDNSY
jgi:hypothetical protein